MAAVPPQWRGRGRRIRGSPPLPACPATVVQSGVAIGRGLAVAIGSATVRGPTRVLRRSKADPRGSPPEPPLPVAIGRCPCPAWRWPPDPRRTQRRPTRRSLTGCRVLARDDWRSSIATRKGPTARPDIPRSRVVTVRETASASRDGSPSGDAERWLPGRSRPRPGSRCGSDTPGRRWRPSGHRRGRTGAGGGTRAPGAPCIVSPVRPRSGIGLRPARTRLASPRPGSGASWGRFRSAESVFLGAWVRAKRRASSLWSFSVTACSMIVARSPSGTEERMRARSRSSLSWSSAEAVNWTL